MRDKIELKFENYMSKAIFVILHIVFKLISFTQLKWNLYSFNTKKMKLNTLLKIITVLGVGIFILS